MSPDYKAFAGRERLMASPRHCPDCGQALIHDAPAGLCPACLARQGLALLGVSAPADRASAQGTRLVNPLAETPSARTEPQGANVSTTAVCLGDYELLAELAHGGMGVVYRARQISLNRMVALKMIRSGQLATPMEVQRFRTEAEAAARLDHPHIVPIHDVGEHEGRHFFTMKLVEGGSLAEAIGGRPMPGRRAARLLAKVARAVHFAHQRGILHRDLKPTNILLDAQDEPQLTDFGLAKLIEQETHVTQSAEVMGSASYMSPEQANGCSRQLTTATDVYSLGAVLYEMLTGRPPFQGETFMDTLHQVVERNPARPSESNPAVDRDLDTICLKCLEKLPAHRYASAEALAQDLEHWTAGETILARPSTTWERTVKWARRKPAIAALLALVVLVGAAGLGGIVYQLRKVEATARKLHQNLYVADMGMAHRAYLDNHLGRAVELLRKYIPAPGDHDVRGFEWRYLWKRTRGQELCTWKHDAFVEDAEFSPNGRWLASLGRDRCVRVWDAVTRQAVTNLPGVSVPADHSVTLFFSPDSRFLVATLPVDGSANQLWTWETGTWRPVAHLPEIKLPAFFTRDSRTLITRVTGSAAAWDTATWQRQPDPPAAFTNLGRFCMRPTGGRYFCAVRTNTLCQIWDLETERVRDEVPVVLEPTWGQAVAFTLNHAGNLLALANWKGEARLYEVPSGRLRTNWAAHASPIFGLRFSPDDQVLATGGFDQVVHLWDTATLAPRGTLRGHFSEVWTVAFSPDGQVLASAGKDTTVRLWSTQVHAEQTAISNVVVPLGFIRDGRCLIGMTDQRQLGLWEFATGKQVASPLFERAVAPKTSAIGFTADGRLLAVGDEQGHVALSTENAPTGRVLNAHADIVTALEFSADGAQLLSCSLDEVRLWDAASGRELKRFPGVGRRARFAPDGRRFVACGPEFTAQIWSLENGRPAARLRGHIWTIWDCLFSPDSSRVVTTSMDGTARVWDAADGRLLATLTGHKEGIPAAAFSPDGHTLATGSTDDTVKLWSTVNYQEFMTVADFGEDIGAVLFAPDGNSLVVGGRGESGTKRFAQVWRGDGFSIDPLPKLR